MKEKITKEQWANHCSVNSYNSYSLVINLCILMLWEKGVKTEIEANEELIKMNLHLSGAQAGMAISFALKYDAEDWLDEIHKKVARRELLDLEHHG